MSSGLKPPDKSIEYTDQHGSEWVINIRDYDEDAREIEICCDYIHFEWGDTLDGAKAAEFSRLLGEPAAKGIFEYEFDNEKHTLNYERLAANAAYNFFGGETLRFKSICRHAARPGVEFGGGGACDITFDIPLNIAARLIKALRGTRDYREHGSDGNPKQAALFV